MIYTFSTFRLDPDKSRLWRGDEVVPLTPKAFQILLALVTRPGEVVEKDELLTLVWPNTFVEEGILAQNISTLRKALGDSSDHPTYIATIPRRGYRFIATLAADPAASASEAIMSAAAPTPHASSTAGPQLRWAVTCMVFLVAVGIGLISRQWRSGMPDAVRVAFSLAPPKGFEFSTSGGVLAVSPDGRHITFVASDENGSDSLWIRSIDSPSERRVPGTDGAAQPFWSADSRFVAYFSGGKLRKIGVAGEASEIICSAPAGSPPLAGSWNSQGDILFSNVNQGIYRVQTTGGVATRLDSPQDPDSTTGWPSFLPDGRHFLFVDRHADPTRAGIFVGSLDSPDRSRVAPFLSAATYASGRLIYADRGAIWAQRFDLDDRHTHGEPFQIAENVAFNSGTGRATFSVSLTGVLAYRTVAETRLTWFDRAGKVIGSSGPVGTYFGFAISPDNRRIAAARLDPLTGTSDLWVLDADGGQATRLTFDPGWDLRPLWSPDGSRIVFTTDRGGDWAVYEKAANGSGIEQPLPGPNTTVLGPQDWLPDGRLLVHRRISREDGDIWIMSPASQTKLIPVSPSQPSAGRISPDGRWLAYETWNESQRLVFVESIDRPGARWQISPDRGSEPRWTQHGKELIYLGGDLSLFTSDIETGVRFHASPPRRLFSTGTVAPTGLTGQAYDVTPDGQKFLVKVPASSPPIQVIVNWPRDH